MDQDELVFVIGAKGVRLAQIQEEVRATWRDMLVPGTAAHATAVAKGIRLDQLPPTADEAVDVRSNGAGVASVEVIVALLLADIARDVWKHVLLPRLKRRFGDQVLTESSSAQEKKSK